MSYQIKYIFLSFQKGGVKGPTGTITGTGTAQRLVLATQGQGGQLVTQQILLPNIQSNAINLKSLQGLKVIPIQQQGKGKISIKYSIRKFEMDLLI